MGTFSHSEVDQRNRCHRAWFYGYAMGIEKEKRSEALSRGILGHAGLEAFFKGIQAGRLFSDARAAAEEHVVRITNAEPAIYAHLLGDVLRAYKFFFEAYPFAGWTVLAVEESYMLQINDDLSVPVVIDLLIEDPFGDIWVVDNKFLYDFPTGVENEILPQLPLYMGVARANGINVTKAGYSILRTRTLKSPTTETMYKFERVDITQTRIERNITEHAIMAERCHTDKQKSLEELSWEAIRVKQPRICNMCDFSDICLAELNGHQPELVLATFYKGRVRRNFSEVSK